MKHTIFKLFSPGPFILKLLVTGVLLKAVLVPSEVITKSDSKLLVVTFTKKSQGELEGWQYSVSFFLSPFMNGFSGAYNNN
jgi:hypothetical protein